MASLLPENRECINGCDEFDTVEVLEIDSALLMSQLLDESHAEDCDDERLTSVIQSLEDEINPIMMDGHDSFMELEWDHNLQVSDECNFSNGGQVGGQDCSSASCDELDYNWMDMEDMKSFYLDPSEEGMEGIIEFGGLREYYNCYNYNSYANSLEEHSYGSLWQDTNV